MQVLLIEDNPGDARLVSELLKECGGSDFKLTTAETLGGALKELKKQRFDVVLSDLSLPDNTGLAGIETITSLNPEVPVIVLTSINDENMGVLSLKKNASDYLVKGQVSASLLSRSIRYSIERKAETQKLIEARRVAGERAIALKELTANLENTVEQRTGQLLKASSELERSRRMADVGRLASTISHELRNPLAAIKLAAYNLRRKTNDASLLPHLNNINKKIEEGDNIIQNLLSFSRARTTKYEVFALSELLDECIVATQSQSNDITVKKAVKLGAKDLIEADPTQLRIVLNNILDNAFQAMSEQSGKITVSACIMGPSYIVSVQDSGMGIEPENLEKVFEPFFTTKSKGTGLGLAVCKDIIESHHGHIELRSAPQKGTTFTITIPSHQPLSAAGIAENKVSY